jgi:DNA-binding transcriptional LysR family regulator
MSLDPRLLRSFVVLAEELHFGRAAARLHVAQPALSQQVKRLEAQLGMPLFARTRRSVALTDAGRELIVPARAAVEAAAATVALARSLADGEAGELRLGLSPGIHYLAQDLLAEHARRRPGVRVRARQESTGELARRVAAGDVELALGCCAGDADGVALERVGEQRAVVAVAHGHRLAGRDAVALAELAGETIALVDAADGPGYNRRVLELCRGAGFEPRVEPDPRGPMAWETGVREGRSVGMTTRWAAVSAARGVRLLELEPPVALEAELLLPRHGALSPAARAFAEIARERTAAAQGTTTSFAPGPAA